MTRDEYLKNANTVAEQLLGQILVHKTQEGTTAGKIVEVEAYIGPDDKGSHAYMNRRSPRTEIQFGNGGYAYIYTIYGMYNCFNVVTNVQDKPEVVLVRALEPVVGIDLMRKRRKVDNEILLCNGPGKLCAAMGISKKNYGDDLCGDSLFITEYEKIEKSKIMVSPRVNIDYAEESKDYLWRYYIAENTYVSKVPKKYRGISILERNM